LAAGDGWSATTMTACGCPWSTSNTSALAVAIQAIQVASHNTPPRAPMNMVRPPKLARYSVPDPDHASRDRKRNGSCGRIAAAARAFKPFRPGVAAVARRPRIGDRQQKPGARPCVGQSWPGAVQESPGTTLSQRDVQAAARYRRSQARHRSRTVCTTCWCSSARIPGNSGRETSRGQTADAHGNCSSPHP